MNQPFIIIEYVSTESLEKILYDFSESYKDQLKLNGISIFRRKGDNESFLLTFDEPVDFMLFSFLVNYLRYPIDFGKSHKPGLYGYYKPSDIKEAYVTGDWLMVYIDPNDKDGDNVSFTTDSGGHYINDFGSGIKRRQTPGKPYEFVKADVDDYNHVITIVTEDLKGREVQHEARPWWKFW